MTPHHSGNDAHARGHSIHRNRPHRTGKVTDPSHIVVLPSIWHRNLFTVIELVEVLRAQNQPNIQLGQEIRSENQVLALKEHYWRLSVRRSPSIRPKNFDTVIERAQALQP